jgi:hypothetical protein
MVMITSEVLPAELLQAISDVVVQEARAVRVGRQLVQIEKVDRGAQTYKYRKFTGFTTVEEIPEGSEFPLEGVTYSEETASIKKIGKAFYITKEEYMANKLHSIAQLARDAAEVVALKEDELIINELVSDAGQSVTADATWDTTGDPYDDVSDALTKLEANNYKGDVLVLHPNEAGDLRRIDSDAHTSYRELIDGLGLKVVATPKLTTGTGLLLDTKRAGVLAVAEDITVEGPEYRQSNQSYLVNVYERIVPVCRIANAVCKLSGI